MQMFSKRLFSLTKQGYLGKFPLHRATTEAKRNCCDFIIGDPVADNIGMVARSMEFGLEVAPEIIVQQKGKSFDYGYLKCDNKYGYLKTNGVMTFDDAKPADDISATGAIKTAVDGFNQEGLTCDLLFFPKSCGWPELEYDKSNPHKNIICVQLLEYILGNCKTVGDVSDVLNTKNVWGTIGDIDEEKDVLNKYYTAHFQVFDRYGKGLVIEYINGENCSQLSKGVMTNEPDYNYHVSNIKQYSNLTSDTRNIAEEDFNGEGNGLIGLPGDPTPPSRFIRCYYYKKFIEENKKPQTSQDALIIASHVLNSVDIPKGVAGRNGTFDFTQWVNIKDIFDLKMYFRDYEKIDWEQFDLGSTLESLKTGEQKVLKEFDANVNINWKNPMKL